MEGIFDNVKGYIDTKIQMVKMEVLEKASNIFTTLILFLATGFMILMMLLFLSLALGNYLNELCHSSFMGFAIMGLFFLIIVILLAGAISSGYFHTKLRKFMSKMINMK